jgi:CheY-like chemotaxis protein
MTDTGTPIMVIDDDEDIREMLRIVLEVSGYSVETVADGAEGWDHLAAGPLPSLIILDLMMPRMDGEQFISKLRASAQPNIPVIIMSGQNGATERARDVHADAVLMKPVDLDVLLGTIAQFVSRAPS